MHGMVKASAAGLVSAAFVASSGATTLYSSNGFESPTFVVGDVVGQDGFATFVSNPGSLSTGTIGTDALNGRVFTGDQSLALDRGPDGLGTNTFFRPVNAPSHAPIVTVSFDLFVEGSGNQSTDPGFESFGPGFSLEVFSSGAQRLLGVGVDSADGSFTQLTDNSGGITFTAGTVVVLDQFQAWDVILDFADESYFVVVDGVAITSGGISFLEDIDFAGGDVFTDAGFALAATDTFFPDVTGRAFVDNFEVTAGTVIPEPSSILCLASLAGLGITRRRRRG